MQSDRNDSLKCIQSSKFPNPTDDQLIWPENIFLVLCATPYFTISRKYTNGLEQNIKILPLQEVEEINDSFSSSVTLFCVVLVEFLTPRSNKRLCMRELIINDCRAA